MNVPTIILVGPQMGENIGFVMRTLANFGGTSLRLVSPRDPWPNPVALTVASGASDFVSVTSFPTLQQATENLSVLVAITARRRDLKKTLLTLGKDALEEDVLLCKALKDGSSQSMGLVFGPEQSGLSNEVVSLCHRALTIPTNKSFPSLNLSHAVAVCLGLLCLPPPYSGTGSPALFTGPTPPCATKKTLDAFLTALEAELEKKGFFSPAEKASKMRHNLRDLFLRSPLSQNDIQTLFGVVKTLAQNVDK